MRLLFLFLLSVAISFVFPLQVAEGKLLSAEGKDTDTYKLITAGGYGYEVPDRSRQHKNDPHRHIRQVYDEELERYVFSFQIHALIDDDRGIPSITDRQRVEIKTYNASPSTMVAKEGESLVMGWKMRLPKEFKTTRKFCHLHQLKGIDNKDGTADVKHPLITLTACTVKGEQRFELRYFDRSERKMKKLKSLDLKNFLGKWVEITENVTFGINQPERNNGDYSILISSVKDGKEILSFHATDLDLWQTDCESMRPKWGIYRSLGENRSLEKELRDEEVLFTDFFVTQVRGEYSSYAVTARRRSAL